MSHNDSKSEVELSGSETVGSEASEADCEFEDVSITCVDCEGKFVWSCGEQTFFRDKGLENPPKRCKPCKNAKNERIKAIENSQSCGMRQKIEVAVDCAKCGENTTVPFYPSQGRPVYCRSCYLVLNPQVLEKDKQD